jgi:AcrR family transcriptional regulator
MARAGLTTERLIHAGAQLADEIGFEKMTGAELARRFDVKLASLYSHVDNFDDLKLKIALLALREMAELAADALAGRSGKDALVALADVYRDYARKHPGRFVAARFPMSSANAAASAGPRLAQMTQAVLRGYALSEADQVHATRLLGSFFMGFVTLELSQSFSHSAPEAQTSWTRSLDALDAMLKTWAGQGAA